MMPAPSSRAVGTAPIAFNLPRELEASSPREARGLARDEVRMMVSRIDTDEILHTSFRALPQLLEPGDVVVINTSRTLNAALDGRRSGGERVEVHLSTHLDDDVWSVELRRPSAHGSLPMLDAVPGETIVLAESVHLKLLAPHGRSLPGAFTARDAESARPVASAYDNHDATHGAAAKHFDPTQRADGVRLWRARLELHEPFESYLERNGRPIRYGYVSERWPMDYYQNVYAIEPGSAEMPSAGRPFTTDMITRLVASGVLLVPLVLHAGVASLESHESPYGEYYRIPDATARVVNDARAHGGRIVAIGTTVVRALESAADRRGIVHEREGWTDLVITPNRAMRVVDALLTGMHESSATHLAMLEALAGRSHVLMAYREALNERYLWHEFGDVHLLLRETAIHGPNSALHGDHK